MRFGILQQITAAAAEYLGQSPIDANISALGTTGYFLPRYPVADELSPSGVFSFVGTYTRRSTAAYGPSAVYGEREYNPGKASFANRAWESVVMTAGGWADNVVTITLQQQSIVRVLVHMPEYPQYYGGVLRFSLSGLSADYNTTSAPTTHALAWKLPAGVYPLTIEKLSGAAYVGYQGILVDPAN